MKRHTYEVKMNWTGNDGEGTKDYRSYRRDHEIFAGDKGPILGSSDPAFRGDAQRFSPEELLVSTLSSCHMLWYLHLCSVNGVVVLDYRDTALGEMDENADGSGQFTRVTLRPKITVALGSDRVRALTLHEEAHRFCFIARSVNFPVRCVAEIVE
jgi:organic hydroperoxide reductase OsmC/OhrA